MHLTEPTRRVLALARDHAQAMGEDFAGTGHIFFALVDEQAGVAARVLSSLGFETGEVDDLLHGPRSVREERADGPAWLSRPAKMAVECALQEALVLGQRDAEPEHLLLGLLRTTHVYAHSAFVRLVGFEDRLRIRNETLRLVARPPSAHEVAWRKAKARAGPHSEFEAYALRAVLDVLKSMPDADRSSVARLTLRLILEEDKPERPEIDAEWNTRVELDHRDRPSGYRIRIPQPGLCGQPAEQLRQSWVNSVVGSSGVTSAPGEAEMECALLLLGRRLAELVNDTDEVWEQLGRGVPIVVMPPRRRVTRDAEPG